MNYQETSFSSESLSGEFLNSLLPEQLIEIRKYSSSELLDPSLRRANLFFKYMGTVICLLESKRHWFVMGDALFVKAYPVKEQTILREAAFETLYFYALERGVKILGYYLEYPLVSKRFRVQALGLSMRASLRDRSFRGKEFTEIRRAWNGFLRDPELQFSEENPTLFTEEGRGFDYFYARFLSHKKPPHIKLICAEPGDLSKTPWERVFALKRRGGLMAVVCGFSFDAGKSFYLDCFFPCSNYRGAVDILLGQVIAKLQEEGVNELSFGLSPFAGEEAQKTLLFRIFYRSKIWYRPMGLYRFKRKYAKDMRTVYMFSEAKQGFLKQLIAFFFLSIQSGKRRNGS